MTVFHCFCYLWTYFTAFSSVSVDFDLENVTWVTGIWKLDTHVSWWKQFFDDVFKVTKVAKMPPKFTKNKYFGSHS